MQLTDAQRLDWLRLIRTEGIGPRSFRSLINRFGGAAAALEALPDLSRRQAGASSRSAGRKPRTKSPPWPRLGGRLLATGEATYPRLLQLTDAAPPLIALRGAPQILNRPSVALVGSRNASTAGLAFTERLARASAKPTCRRVGPRAGSMRGRTKPLCRPAPLPSWPAPGSIYPASHVGLVTRSWGGRGGPGRDADGLEARGRDFPGAQPDHFRLAYGTIVVEAARRPAP